MKKEELIQLLEEQQDERGIEHWENITSTLGSYGIGLTILRKLAKQIGKNHDLAKDFLIKYLSSYNDMLKSLNVESGDILKIRFDVQEVLDLIYCFKYSGVEWLYSKEISIQHKELAVKKSEIAIIEKSLRKKSIMAQE